MREAGHGRQGTFSCPKRAEVIRKGDEKCGCQAAVRDRE